MVSLTFFYALANDMFFAAIPAVGFALIFSTPPSALKFCAISAAIGHGLRFILLSNGADIACATLAASSCIGFIGVYWSHHFLAHPKVITVAGIIPMIPGIFAYKAMIAFVQIHRLGYSHELWAIMADNLAKTMFVVGALAIGLSMPGLLFYRGKPVI